MASTSDHHQERVVSYYNATKRDYRILWRTGSNLGIHFGYYESGHESHNTAVINLNKKLAALIGVSSKDTVLDAGCGIGGSSLWLAENYRCRVTGINIVPWQVEYAKSLAAQRQISKLVNFKLADFSDTKFKSGVFTVYWGLESIVHAEDKQAVIDEAYRLLRSGGKLVICEYLLTKEKLEPQDQELIGKWLDGWAMPSLLSEKKYKTFLRNAGFRDVATYDWTERVNPSFKRLAKLITIFRPLAPLSFALRIVNQGQLSNLYASDAQIKALAKNLWQYKVIVAHKP